MKKYFQHEQQHANEALPLSPIDPLLQKISFFQKLEKNDDQMVHLEHIDNIPAVHIPFGIANK